MVRESGWAALFRDAFRRSRAELVAKALAGGHTLL
jgi:hypothetical protein